MRFTKTQDDKLRPFDRAASEFVSVLNTAEPINMYPVEDNESHYRGYVFAFIREVALAIKMRPEALRAELLLETGRFQKLGEMFGKQVVAVDSMSRAHMSDAELRRFWREAASVIQRKILFRVGDHTERDRLNRRLLEEAPA